MFFLQTMSVQVAEQLQSLNATMTNAILTISRKYKNRNNDFTVVLEGSGLHSKHYFLKFISVNTFHFNILFTESFHKQRPFKWITEQLQTNYIENRWVNGHFGSTSTINVKMYTKEWHSFVFALTTDTSRGWFCWQVNWNKSMTALNSL